jgi:hypothetical protein
LVPIKNHKSDLTKVRKINVEKMGGGNREETSGKEWKGAERSGKEQRGVETSGKERNGGRRKEEG